MSTRIRYFYWHLNPDLVWEWDEALGTARWLWKQSGAFNGWSEYTPTNMPRDMKEVFDVPFLIPELLRVSEGL